MKVCSKCQEKLSLDNFSFDKRRNRHQPQCKKCRASYYRNMYSGNKKKCQERASEYKKANRNKHLEYCHSWYAKNKDRSICKAIFYRNGLKTIPGDLLMVKVVQLALVRKLKEMKGRVL